MRCRGTCVGVQNEIYFDLVEELDTIINRCVLVRVRTCLRGDVVC